MKIDLHVHTKGSDGYGNSDEIAQAALAAGLHGVAITDHHRTRTAKGEFVAQAMRAVGLVVFRGCEYSTQQGHVLVYGVDIADFNFGYYQDAQTVIDRVQARGGVVIPAHPAHGYTRTLGDPTKLKRLYAVEGLNGQLAVRDPEKNRQCLDWLDAGPNRLLVTGGSDAHDPDYIGVAYTEFAAPIRTEAELVEALKAGDFVPGLNRSLCELLAKRWRTEAIELHPA